MLASMLRPQGASSSHKRAVRMRTHTKLDQATLHAMTRVQRDHGALQRLVAAKCAVATAAHAVLQRSDVHFRAVMVANACLERWAPLLASVQPVVAALVRKHLRVLQASWEPAALRASLTMLRSVLAHVVETITRAAATPTGTRAALRETLQLREKQRSLVHTPATAPASTAVFRVPTPIVRGNRPLGSNPAGAGPDHAVAAARTSSARTARNHAVTTAAAAVVVVGMPPATPQARSTSTAVQQQQQQQHALPPKKRMGSHTTNSTAYV